MSSAFFGKPDSQPGSCHAPITLDRCLRSADRFGSLFNSQPAEITQFHNACLLSIHCGKSLQSRIECQEIDSGLIGQTEIFIQGKFLGWMWTFVARVMPRMV